MKDKVMSTEDFRLLLLFMSFLFYGLKINSHMALFYSRGREYPGFVSAYRDLPIYKKLQAFLPLPHFATPENSRVNRWVWFFLLVFWISFITGMVLPPT